MSRFPKDVTDGYSLEIRNDEIWITEKVTICCFKNKPKIKILLPFRLPLYTVALRHFFIHQHHPPKAIIRAVHKFQKELCHKYTPLFMRYFKVGQFIGQQYRVGNGVNSQKRYLIRHGYAQLHKGLGRPHGNQKVFQKHRVRQHITAGKVFLCPPLYLLPLVPCLPKAA